MPATGHSLFPASGAKRLLACPASYGLSLAVDDGERRASVHSAEGTLAHLIAEAKLLSGVDLSYFEGMTRTVDRAFVDGVRVYTDYVELLRSLGYAVQLEVPVSPAWLWSDLPPLPIELYGTSDCVALSPDGKRLAVVDLKFGKGLAVDPYQNEQLMYYALGAAEDYPTVELIDLVIIQPRIFGDRAEREWTVTPAELVSWGIDTLYPGVLRSIADMGATAIAGDHCQFCPARFGCSAPRELAAELSRQGFLALPAGDEPADPNVGDPLDVGAGKPANLFGAMAVSDDRLQQILDVAAVVEPILKEAKDIAKARILLGTSFHGWEVIERSGPRTWDLSVAELMTLLENNSFNPLPIIQAKSPAQVEERYPDVFELLRQHAQGGEPQNVLQQTKMSRKRSPRRDPAALPGASSDVGESNG